MGRNGMLNLAGKVKRDDFYTSYSDIEAEMAHYRERFRGKSVLCNCDSPIESNFFLYFLKNFESLGLSKLSATCYAGAELPGTIETECRSVPEGFKRGRAYRAVVTNPNKLTSKSNFVDFRALFELPENSLLELDGDGDFRSPECVAILDESDIVVTNPPFSLFREFIGLLTESDKNFVIIGNINALTYKEVFPLIRDNLIWLGPSIRAGDRRFYVPDSYSLDAAACGLDDEGRKFIRVKGVRWFTNLNAASPYDRLELVNRFEDGEYTQFENYDAINVKTTRDIPRDYPGLMGVPITFLDKYSPDQFDIIMLANGNARTNNDQDTLEFVGYRHHAEDRGGVGIIDGRRTYVRLIIKNLNPESAVA